MVGGFWIMQVSLALSVVLQIQCLDNRQLARRRSLNRKNRPNASVEHPMLYFSPDHIAELRRKASTTHEKIAVIIKAVGEEFRERPKLYMPPVEHAVFASQWNEQYGNRLCAFSFYCLLYPEDTKVLDLVKEYMDRMSRYPDWYVASSYGRDQVPIGHSLTGFATAYDLLYDALEPPRRKMYYETIKNVTRDLCEVLSKGRGSWPEQYIHNHAPSNIVAILLGALNIDTHEPGSASRCIELSRIHMDRALEILKLVTDGSMDEGVSYGSYTTRGITQYIFLMKRHFGTDRTNNPWLKQYFWSLYKTLLPGFQRAVGIADSSHNWFYGPESQLVFLDAFVLRNGHGNWLADKIRSTREDVWKGTLPCMIHTEFIFYDASLEPVQPTEDARSKLFMFADWGVVTYGGGQDDHPGNTFLSFKSGAVNGEAVHEIISDNLFPDFVNGWRNFNAGHEHPDQNSFVFAPNGKYFITEALYGPKYSFLDNVLIFSPSDTSKCNQPWEGQIGECNKWLRYKEYDKSTSGEILTATAVDEMAFIAGESASVYSKALGLSSVYRGMLLLNPEVLVVVDTIRLHPGSNTKLASAMFHNMMHKFEQHTVLGYEGAYVGHEDGDYSMFSMTQSAKSTSTSINNQVQPAGLREGPTNYVNVTFELNDEVTNVVHVFYGPHNTVNSASFVAVGSSGVRIFLRLNGVDHKISIATIVRSTERRLLPWTERKKVTGFGGYARVDAGSRQYRFGLKTREQNYALPSDDHSTKRPLTGRTASERWFEGHVINITQLIFLSSMSVVALLALLSLFGTRGCLKYIKNANGVTIIAVAVLFLLVSINSFCIDSGGFNACWRAPESERKRTALTASRPTSTFEMPFVFMTSLPGSGIELLGSLFNESNEFLYIATPGSDITIPSNGIDLNKPDLCIWRSLENKYNSLTMGWFHSLKKQPHIHFNNIPDSQDARNIKLHFRGHRNTPTALSSGSGFWTTKIQWARNVIGDSLQPFLVVRDPRSWVHAILDESRRSKDLNVLHSLISAFEKMLQRCDVLDVIHPNVVGPLKELQSRRKGVLKTVEKLAAVWTVSTASALQQGQAPGTQFPLQVIRFEDIMRDPQRTAEDVFAHLGVPLSLKRLSKLERTIKSGFYNISFIGTAGPAALDRWEDGLTAIEVKHIEYICLPLMTILGYE